MQVDADLVVLEQLAEVVEVEVSVLQVPMVTETWVVEVAKEKISVPNLAPDLVKKGGLQVVVVEEEMVTNTRPVLVVKVGGQQVVGQKLHHLTRR